MKPTAVLVLLVVSLGFVACEVTEPEPDPIARLEDQRLGASVELVAFLRDPLPERRARAALAMGRIQSPAYVGALSEATRAEAYTAAVSQLRTTDGMLEACDSLIEVEGKLDSYRALRHACEYARAHGFLDEAVDAGRRGIEVAERLLGNDRNMGIYDTSLHNLGA